MGHLLKRKEAGLSVKVIQDLVRPWPFFGLNRSWTIRRSWVYVRRPQLIKSQEKEYDGGHLNF